MKNKENKEHRILVPQENISFQPTHPEYEEGKNILSPIMYELFLFDINDQEFRCDGSQYIGKVIGGIHNSPSPHIHEVIQMTIDFVGLFNLHEKLEDFLKRVKSRSMEEFYVQHQSMDHWIQVENYVYPLRPEKSVDPNYLPFYKFFLPFKLKHIQPENVGNILDYHRHKYYRLDPRSFFNIITKILEDKNQSFWFNSKTIGKIQNWLDKNRPEEEEAYWFELKDKYDVATKKGIISLLYHDLRNQEKPFIDHNETYRNLYRLFSKPNNQTKFKKVNWVGHMGELNYFVKTLVVKNKIGSKNIWITCSNLFLIKGEEFSSVKIGQSVYISESRKAELLVLIQHFKGTNSKK